MPHIKKFTLRSIQFLSFCFHLSLILRLPSPSVLYCHVAINSVLNSPDQIYRLPPHSIEKLHVAIHSVTFSFFLCQYNSSPPIFFHCGFSNCNSLCSNQVQYFSPYTVMIHIKTFTLWYIKFLSVPTIFLYSHHIP